MCPVGGAGDRPRGDTVRRVLRRPALLRARHQARVALRSPAVAVGVAVAAVLGAALAGPWNPALSENRHLPWNPPVTLPKPRPVRPDRDPPPEWRLLHRALPWDFTVLGVALIVLAAVLVLIVLALVVRALRRRVRSTHPALRLLPDQPGAGDPDLRTLRAGVAAAGDRLGDGGEPGDGVVAAWVALEDAAARSGVPRDPAATPTEFTVAVLDATPADRAATRALLALYLRARFGGGTVPRRDAAAARAALDRLRETLRDAAAPSGSSTPAGAEARR